MKGVAILIIVLLALLILVGAGIAIWAFVIQPRESKDRCTKDSDCPSTDFCGSDGRCVPYGKCEKGSDCVGGQVCVDGECRECGVNKDCSMDPGKPYCYQGKCVGCRDTKDCKSGVCDMDIHRCVTCVTNDQCPKGYQCLEGEKPELNQCVQCTSNSDCPSGKECVGNSCQTTGPSGRLITGPPAMPPVTRLGSPLKPLTTAPHSPYHVYGSSW